VNVKEIPAWLVGVGTAVFGAYTAHTHPEWAQWIVALVACVTHHTGKVAGEAVAKSNGTAS
jgi:hypothetical protein